MMNDIKAQLQDVPALLERFKTTLEVIIPTFNYVDALDDSERDYCEETFYQISPCYMYMYSVVIDKKIPDAYNTNNAQFEMFDQIKLMAQISAATYKKMRLTIDDANEHTLGFYALLETFLLMYYAYINGLSS